MVSAVWTLLLGWSRIERSPINRIKSPVCSKSSMGLRLFLLPHSPVPALSSVSTSRPPAAVHQCCLSDHYGQGHAYRSPWILKRHGDSGPEQGKNERLLRHGGRRERVWSNYRQASIQRLLLPQACCLSQAVEVTAAKKTVLCVQLLQFPF